MEVTVVDVVIESHWDWMECVQLGGIEKRRCEGGVDGVG